MNFSNERNLASYFIVIAVFTITGLVIWNTILFFNRFKEDERARMEIWASSQKALNHEQLNSSSSDEYLDLSLQITASNHSIPIIITDDQGNILHDFCGNIPESTLKDEEKLISLLNKMRSENPPIELDLYGNVKQYIYYGNSDILNKLKYYPVAIILILLLLIGVVYFFFTTSKASEQNKLWAGMAKETAHQIGTPLSSLVGWSEILKTENVDPEYLKEIDKDIARLQVITERFSKIGSIPNLQQDDIVSQTKDAYDYLKRRNSRLINFSNTLPDAPIFVNINTQLYSWTIENLVKNAIDAMRGKGDLSIDLKEDTKRVHILISDTGKGIPKSKFSKIFEPGYTSKSRGWGLGLSLAKRIIEEYHMGRIKVLRSEIGKGTTFQISLPKI
ncbi:sensor histidine kinase [Aquimarina rhabdastrellae]